MEERRKEVGVGGDGQVSLFRGSLSLFRPLCWLMNGDLGAGGPRREKVHLEGSISGIASVQCDFFYKMKSCSSPFPGKAQPPKQAAHTQDGDLGVEKGLLLGRLSSGRMGRA